MFGRGYEVLSKTYVSDCYGSVEYQGVITRYGTAMVRLITVSAAFG